MSDVDQLFAATAAALASRGITLDAATFGTYVRGKGGTLPPQLEELALAFACLQRDAKAIAEFEKQYFAEAERALKRMNASQTVVDDVTSWMRGELFVRPAGGLLGSYSGRGSLAGWVRSVATHEALKRLDEGKREAPADALDELPMPSPELDAMRGAHGEKFTRAFANAFASLSTDERNLLRQHFLDGLSIDVLGRLHQVHRATAARRIQAAKVELVDRVRATLKLELGMTTSGIDDVITLSNLEQSLGSLLKQTKA